MAGGASNFKLKGKDRFRNSSFLRMSERLRLGDAGLANRISPSEIRQGQVSKFVLVPVIPAKAGIQTVAAKFAIRNQAQIPAGESPSPFMGLRG